MNNPEKEITDKQSDFLEALLGEARGNIRAAMDIAGYSKMTKTSEVVSSLREEITERAGSGPAKPHFSNTELLNPTSVFLGKKIISPGTPNAWLCLDFLLCDRIADLVNKGFHEVLVTCENVDGLSGSSPKSSVVISPSPFSRSEIKEDVSRIR